MSPALTGPMSTLPGTVSYLLSTIYYLLRTTHQYTAGGIGSWWLVAQYAECCYIVKYYQSHFKVDMLIHDNNSTRTASGAAADQSWGSGEWRPTFYSRIGKSLIDDSCSINQSTCGGGVDQRRDTRPRPGVG